MDSNNQPALSWTEIGKQTSGSLLNIGLQLKQFIGFGKDARNEGALVMKIAPGLSDYRSRDLLLLTAAGYERWTLSLNQSDRVNINFLIFYFVLAVESKLIACLLLCGCSLWRATVLSTQSRRLSLTKEQMTLNTKTT